MTNLLKQEKVRDRKYLDFIHYNMSCVLCGAKDDTIVGHHVKCLMSGGMSMKPPDNHVIPVCHHCHSEIDRIGELVYFEQMKFLINREEIKVFCENIYDHYKKKSVNR